MSPKKKKKVAKKTARKKVTPKTRSKAKSKPKPKIKPQASTQKVKKTKAVELEVVDKNLKPESSLVSVAAYNPLQRYLKEVSRYPLLDPEEELELVNKMIQDGDLSAAKRLVQANLRLVVKIAMEYSNFYNNLMDLIQEGNIGLMKAVSKYDPSKGARVGYYATWWIRSYVLKYILDNFRLVKIGTTQAQKKLFYHLAKEQEKLQAQGLSFAPKLLAEKLDVKESEVREMQQRLSGGGAEISLNVSTSDESGGNTSFQDLLTDDTTEPIDEKLAQEQWIDILKSNIPEFEKTLNGKEVKVLSDRILSENPKTLQEVANEYGLTRERVRQIEAKIIEKLRDYLKSATRS